MWSFESGEATHESAGAVGEAVDRGRRGRARARCSPVERGRADGGDEMKSLSMSEEGVRKDIFRCAGWGGGAGR